MTLPDPSATLRTLHALAADLTATPDQRDAARTAIPIVEAACRTASCWAGKDNAEVRADVLMPSTVRGTGAAGRNLLVEALDALAKLCA